MCLCVILLRFADFSLLATLFLVCAHTHTRTLDCLVCQDVVIYRRNKVTNRSAEMVGKCSGTPFVTN